MALWDGQLPKTAVAAQGAARSLAGRAAAPPSRAPPDWRLRRERPHRGGHCPPDTPKSASGPPEAPVGG
eukprot:13673074-Alexandrium_andersonii.AAC.1